jgi:hypothetical protein
MRIRNSFSLVKQGDGGVESMVADVNYDAEDSDHDAIPFASDVNYARASPVVWSEEVNLPIIFYHTP